MNYRSLRDDELERLARIEDRAAILELGRRAADVPLEPEESDDYDAGYDAGVADGDEAGVKRGRQELAAQLKRVVASIRRAAKAKGKDAADLKWLADEIEKHAA